MAETGKNAEIRSILSRLFIDGSESDAVHDLLWQRLCELVGDNQPMVMATVRDLDDPARFDVAFGVQVRAALRGSIIAQYHLGAYYARSAGPGAAPRDPNSARYWLRLAIDNEGTEDAALFGTANWRMLARQTIGKVNAGLPLGAVGEDADAGEGAKE